MVEECVFFPVCLPACELFAQTPDPLGDSYTRTEEQDEYVDGAMMMRILKTVECTFIFKVKVRGRERERPS